MNFIAVIVYRPMTLETAGIVDLESVTRDPEFAFNASVYRLFQVDALEFAIEYAKVILGRHPTWAASIQELESNG